MREAVTTGLICVKDSYDFEYKLAKIEYIEREDETYTYIFTPYYSVMELLPSRLFQGIPGLNLDLRKEKYVRENMTPVFISERTPGENREDLWELLEACGMDYLNRLEWLIRTDYTYSGDPMYVRRFEPGDEKQHLEIETIDSLGNRAVYIKRVLLEHICYGNDIETQELTINDANRKQYYALLMSLYKKEKNYIKARKTEGIQKSAAMGKYTGRKRKEVDEARMYEVFLAYHNGKIKVEDAIAQLGLSRSTFYRRYKENKRMFL